MHYVNFVLLVQLTPENVIKYEHLRVITGDKLLNFTTLPLGVRSPAFTAVKNCAHARYETLQLQCRICTLILPLDITFTKNVTLSRMVLCTCWL